MLRPSMRGPGLFAFLVFLGLLYVVLASQGYIPWWAPVEE